MSSKNRLRVTDKEAFKKRQKKKKQDKHDKAKRVHSKDVRNHIRKVFRPYYESFRNDTDKHLLFVIKDTDNMERIILQKIDLGDGYTLLTLPILTEKTIAEYLAQYPENKYAGTDIASIKGEAIKGLVANLFFVVSDDFMDTPKMIAFRNCQLTKLRDDFLLVNVRPYFLDKWFSAESTTISGYRIYKGNKLQSFFQIEGSLGKTYVFYDTLLEILAYRAMVGKLKKEDVLQDHSYYGRKSGYDPDWVITLLVYDLDELVWRRLSESIETEKLNPQQT